MPMSPRLLRPRSTVHPEANAWATRVIANGGTFSSSTLSAVSSFCADIDRAGIRDKFLRLNLFCGSNINAALVPLYVSKTYGGSAIGGSKDTNGTYVSGDYVESGPFGGFSRENNVSGKIITCTSFTANSMESLTLFHYSIGISTQLSTPTGASLISCYPFPTAFPWHCSWFAQDTAPSFILIGQQTDNSANAVVPDNGRLLANRTSATDARTYQNGVQTALFTGSQGSVSGHGTEWVVNGGSNPTRVHYYSIGGSFTSAQILSFDSALSGFLNATGRS